LYLFNQHWVFVLPGSLIVGSLEQIYHKEGMRGMYRGLAPTVLALLPNWAVSLLHVVITLPDELLLFLFESFFFFFFASYISVVLALNWQ